MNTQFRIQFQIRGFDTFHISVYDVATGALLGTLTIPSSDFGDDYIDLDDHTVAFLLTQNGQPVSTPQD